MTSSPALSLVSRCCRLPHAHFIDGRRLMVLHCIQLLPHTPYRDAEAQHYLNLRPGQTEAKSHRDLSLRSGLSGRWYNCSICVRRHRLAKEALWFGPLPRDIDPSKMHVVPDS